MAKPNSAQRQWMADISEWAENGGLSKLGFEMQQFHLHHVVGRAAKHNKVAIGHEFILPIPIHLHDVNSNHPLNVTHHRKAFEANYGTQSELWAVMVSSMREAGYAIPFDIGVREAVATWRR